MSSTATDTVRLELESPETIRCGVSRYRCGGTVYRAVECALKAPKNGVTVRKFAAAIWGERVGAEVSRQTIRSLLHRANDVLTGIGARERLTLDGEAVLLV